MTANNADADASAAPSFSSQTVPLMTPAINIDPGQNAGSDIALADASALVAQEGPAGTTADIINRPTTTQISVYTVRPGDTLSQIAAMFDVPVNTIVWANDIQGGVIQPGEQLTILPVAGLQHTVLKGDTLASLAATYRSDAHDIAAYNNLADGDNLTVGQTIVIPNGQPPAPASDSKNGSKTSGAASTKKSVTRPETSSKAAPVSTTEPYLGGSGPAIPGYFSWPLAGGIVTQGLHGWNAVDIGAPTGTSIYAAAAGNVIVAKDNGAWNGGYGNYVVIQHSNGTQTLYAHMSRVIASVGDHVSQGDLIGKVGATGLATGPHLHFEVRGAQNPFTLLPLGASE